ncbi:MAG: thioredoxin family protein [Eubacterium sp.]|nr:thioredoxin family protein [Eubacterium sp.]
MALRITNQEFEEKVLNSTCPVVVEFYSDSCMACKALSPVLGELEDHYDNKIKVYKVNTGYEMQLSETYEVRSNPTTLIFKEGKEIDRVVGVIPYQELESRIITE